MHSLNFLHSPWLKIFWLEVEKVAHLLKFLLFALTTFFPRQPSFAESCSILMNFGTHIVEVIV